MNVVQNVLDASSRVAGWSDARAQKQAPEMAGAGEISLDGASAARGRQEARMLFDSATSYLSVRDARYRAHERAGAAVRHGLANLDDQGARSAMNDALSAAEVSDAVDGAHEAQQEIRLLRLQSSSQPLAANASASNAPSSTDSLSEVWVQLAKSISTAKSGELTYFESAVQKYTALYQAIANVLTKFSQWVRADDDNHMKVDFAKISTALDEVINKFSYANGSAVIAEVSSQDEAKAICEKLGLDYEKCCSWYWQSSSHSITYRITPDLSQVSKMKEGLTSGQDDFKMSIAAYNAWKAGFDSQMSRIDESLQARGQKYSNQYSRFENFHKTISSIIQSMTDMLRQFLQF